MIEKLAECADAELAKGIDKVDTEEMEKVICMIDKLAEAEYYAQVTKAMDEAKEEKELMAKMGYQNMPYHDMPYHDMSDNMAYYDDIRYYRGQPRNQEGRYKEDGRPNVEPRRRMYDPYVNPTMTSLDMYGQMPDKMPKEFRNANMMHDEKEGRWGNARKRYMETKEQHSDDKPMKLKDLDVAMTDLGTDIKEMVMGMTPEEKTMAKTKLQNIMNNM